MDPEREGRALLEDCRGRGWTIAVAESCTAGGLGWVLTKSSGSSDVFWGGFIVYANRAKTELLGLSPQMIETKGAVSQEVAIAMAKRVRERSSASLGIAITGVAGPGGGSPTKPVGTVWIAAACEGGVESSCFSFEGDRETVRGQAVIEAIRMGRKLLSLNNLYK